MDKYHIYGLIGKGDFSEVFKGREKKSIEYVAIKRIEKSKMDKVVSEVQILHKLKSPHVLKFHDWYETRNNLWVIIEYCTGGDLEKLLKGDIKLPESSIRDFGYDILSGLKYLHSLGVLHCDIKPKNFLIDEFGILKISDFKYARKIPKIGEISNKSSPMECQHSLKYQAPELYTLDGIFSYSSDLWAYGCILYEMYYGYHPFELPPLNSTTTTSGGGNNSSHNNSNNDANTIYKDAKHIQLMKEYIHSYNPLSVENKQKKMKANNDKDGTFKPMSIQLYDLIQGLLEKSILNRCTWSEILTHPFWNTYKLSSVDIIFPVQPIYEEYLSKLKKQIQEKKHQELLISHQITEIDLLNIEQYKLQKHQQQEQQQHLLQLQHQSDHSHILAPPTYGITPIKPAVSMSTVPHGGGVGGSSSVEGGVHVGMRQQGITALLNSSTNDDYNSTTTTTTTTKNDNNNTIMTNRMMMKSHSTAAVGTTNIAHPTSMMKKAMSEKVLLTTPVPSNREHTATTGGGMTTYDMMSAEKTPMINISKQVDPWMKVNSTNTADTAYNQDNYNNYEIGNKEIQKRMFTSTTETIPTITTITTTTNDMKGGSGVSNDTKERSHDRIPMSPATSSSSIPVTPDVNIRRNKVVHTTVTEVSNTAVGNTTNNTTSSSSNKGDVVEMSSSTKSNLNTVTDVLSSKQNIGPTTRRPSTASSSRPNTANTTTANTPGNDNNKAANSEKSINFTVESLIIHSSDTQIKPIVENKSIEIIDFPSYKSNTLQTNFEIYTVDMLKNDTSITYEVLESHIQMVYKVLSKCTPTLAALQTVSSGISSNNGYQTAQLIERNNILSYLLSISSYKDVANIILHTNLLKCLLRSIQQIPIITNATSSSSKSAHAHNAVSSTNQATIQSNAIITCRITACTILAYAIRYATFIPYTTITSTTQNSNTGNSSTNTSGQKEDTIITILINILKQESNVDVKLKRRMMAALGEISFYISSQDDDKNEDNATIEIQTSTKNILVTPVNSKSKRGTISKSSRSVQDPVSEPVKEHSWNILPNMIDLYESILYDETDDIVLHYTCKAIENIVAQGKSHQKIKFMTINICYRLLQLSLHHKLDAIKISSSITLGNIVHYMYTHPTKSVWSTYMYTTQAHIISGTMMSPRSADTKGTLSSVKKGSLTSRPPKSTPTHKTTPTTIQDLRSDNTAVFSNDLVHDESQIISHSDTIISTYTFILKVYESIDMSIILDTFQDNNTKLQIGYINIISYLFYILYSIIQYYCHSDDSTSVQRFTEDIYQLSIQSFFTDLITFNTNFITNSQLKILFITIQNKLIAYIESLVVASVRLLESTSSTILKSKILIHLQLSCRLYSNAIFIIIERKLPFILNKVLEPVLLSGDNSTYSLNTGNNTLTTGSGSTNRVMSSSQQKSSVLGESTHYNTPNTSVSFSYITKAAMSMILYIKECGVYSARIIRAQLGAICQINNTIFSPQHHHRPLNTVQSIQTTGNTFDIQLLQKAVHHLAVVLSTISVQLSLRKLILCTLYESSHIITIIIQSLQYTKQARLIMESYSNNHNINANNSNSIYNEESEGQVDTKEVLIETEKVLILFYEIISQVDASQWDLWCFPTSYSNSPSYECILPSKTSYFTYLILMVGEYLPLGTSLLSHNDGNIRTQVISSLRKSIPNILKALVNVTQYQSIYQYFQSYMYNRKSTTTSNDRTVPGSSSSGSSRSLNESRKVSLHITTTTTTSTTTANTTDRHTIDTTKDLIENHIQLLLEYIHKPTSLFLPLISPLITLLHDNAPIPQYVIRLLYDCITMNLPVLSYALVQLWNESQVVKELISLMQPQLSPHTNSEATSTKSGASNSPRTPRYPHEIDNGDDDEDDSNRDNAHMVHENTLYKDPLLIQLLHSIFDIISQQDPSHVQKTNNTMSNKKDNSITNRQIDEESSVSLQYNPISPLPLQMLSWKFSDYIVESLQLIIQHNDIYRILTSYFHLKSSSSPSNPGVNQKITILFQSNNSLDLELLSSVLELICSLLSYSLYRISYYQTEIQTKVYTIQERAPIMNQIDNILKVLQPCMHLSPLLVTCLYYFSLQLQYENNVNNTMNTNMMDEMNGNSNPLVVQICETATRCLGLVFDIFPESASYYLVSSTNSMDMLEITGTIQSKQKKSAESKSTDWNISPATLIGHILSNPYTSASIRIRILRLLMGSIKISPIINTQGIWKRLLILSKNSSTIRREDHNMTPLMSAILMLHNTSATTTTSNSITNKRDPLSEDTSSQIKLHETVTQLLHMIESLQS